jgi:hypothetical protein
MNRRDFLKRVSALVALPKLVHALPAAAPLTITFPEYPAVPRLFSGYVTSDHPNCRCTFFYEER